MILLARIAESINSDRRVTIRLRASHVAPPPRLANFLQLYRRRRRAAASAAELHRRRCRRLADLQLAASAETAHQLPASLPPARGSIVKLYFDFGATSSRTLDGMQYFDLTLAFLGQISERNPQRLPAFVMRSVKNLKY